MNFVVFFLGSIDGCSMIHRVGRKTKITRLFSSKDDRSQQKKAHFLDKKFAEETVAFQYFLKVL